MAYSNLNTSISLDEWAQIIGYNPWHFNGLYSNNAQTAKTCDSFWFDGYCGQGTVNRQELAMAISTAEALFEKCLGYPIKPKWQSKVIDIPSGACNPCYKLILGEKHLLNLGVRGVSPVALDQPLEFEDCGMDGFYEWAKVCLTTTVPEEEIKFYYPGKGGDPAWEISCVQKRPDGCYYIPVYTLLKDELCQRCEPLCADDVSIFINTVDVYREYNVPKDLDLFYRSCKACEIVEKSVCGHITNYRLGVVEINTMCQGLPEQVCVYYYNGYTNNKKFTNIPTQFKQAIAYLAVSLLTNDLCTCCGLESAKASRWGELLDRRESGGASSFTTYNNLENIFGVATRGSIFAWNTAKAFRA